MDEHEMTWRAWLLGAARVCREASHAVGIDPTRLHALCTFAVQGLWAEVVESCKCDPALAPVATAAVLATMETWDEPAYKRCCAADPAAVARAHTRAAIFVHAYAANSGIARWAELGAVERLKEAEAVMRENVRLRRLLSLLCAQGVERSAALVEVYFDPEPPPRGPSVRTFLVCSPGDEEALTERLTAELIRHVTPEGHPAPIARVAPPMHTGTSMLSYTRKRECSELPTMHGISPEPAYERPTVRVPPQRWRILGLRSGRLIYSVDPAEPLPAPSAEAAARRFVAETGEVGHEETTTVTLIDADDPDAQIVAYNVTPYTAYRVEPAQ